MLRIGFEYHQALGFVRSPFTVTMSSGAQDSTRVSVIIPTRNSARTIRLCLEAAREQLHKNIEIVVADGKSEDRTVPIIRELADKVLTDAGGRSESRNRALSVATGEFVLALDSDMLLLPRTIPDCLEVIRRGAMAVTIPERCRGLTFWGRASAFDRNLSYHLQVEGSLGVARFFRRADVERAGGWNETMLWGEDFDLQARVCGTSPTAVSHVPLIHIEVEATLRDVYDKWHLYGMTRQRFMGQHPNQANLIDPSLLARTWINSETAHDAILHPVLLTAGLVVKATRGLAILASYRQ
jgi:hypothetical protein